MINIYDDFINKELGKLSKNKKLKIDEIYQLIKDKTTSFIGIYENEIDINKFKIILKAEHDSIDENFIMSLPSGILGIIAIVIASTSLMAQIYDIKSKSNIIGIFSLLFLYPVILMIYNQYIQCIANKMRRKKKILYICYELLDYYKKEKNNLNNEIVKYQHEKQYLVTIS